MAILRPLVPELAKIVQEELGEVPSRVDKDLSSLKDWIKKQPHLYNNVRLDDQWLVAFLRGSKYSIEKAKKKIENFYFAKICFPEFSTKMDPCRPELQILLKNGFMLPLDISNDKPGNPEPILIKVDSVIGLDFDVDDIYRIIHMIFSICTLDHDGMIISGCALIIDLGGNISSLIHYFTAQHVKKIVSLGQSSSPLRCKEVHYINVSSKWDPFIKLFKILVDEKTKKRVHFHRDESMLNKYIPNTCIPKDLGGQGCSIDELRVFWKNKIESYRNWFLEDMKFKSDESKRPSYSKAYQYDLSSVFGTEGTFRELQLD